MVAQNFCDKSTNVLVKIQGNAVAKIKPIHLGSIRTLKKVDVLRKTCTEQSLSLEHLSVPLSSPLLESCKQLCLDLGVALKDLATPKPEIQLNLLERLYISSTL